MSIVPRLRPMGIGDILDAAFRLYREHFLTFVGIVALLQVPVAIIQIVVQATLGSDALGQLMRFSSRPPTLSPGQSIFDVLPIGQLITFYVITLGLGVVQYLIVQNLTMGALANAISRSYLGQSISILTAYNLGVGRYVALIAASLVLFAIGVGVFAVLGGCMTVAIIFLGLGAGQDPVGPGLTILMVLLFVGLLILSIPIALFLFVRLLLTTQAIVLEGQGPLAGLGRSWELTRGSFWRILGIGVLMWLLAYLLSSLPATVVSLALGALGDPVNNFGRNQAITSLVAYIGLIITMPLQLAVFTLLYYDVRIRKEGYDLELMAQQAITS